MKNVRHFDVVIVGGGASGSAAALTLLQHCDCSVAIIEKSDFSEPRIGETIPPDTNQLLAQLGVIPAFRAQEHSTWLESVSYGWWYGARLPGNEAIVALGTDPNVAKLMAVYDRKSWLFNLTGTHLIAPRLVGTQLAQDSFRITASHSYCINRAAGENWIAVGDSASAFDPLSSAGIYKAISTGQLAARVLSGLDSRQAFRERIQYDYGDYLDMRAQLYDAERRWSDHAFWQARNRSVVSTADGIPVS